MSLIVDNETSLECREHFLSQRLPVTFVPPQTHRSNPAERAVRTDTNLTNHLITVFSSTHPDFPDDLWDRLLPCAEITLNVMRSWRPDPYLSAWSGLHLHSNHTTSPPTLFTPLANSALPSQTLTTATLGPLTGIAPFFTLGPALTHYCCQRVYIVSSRSERITLTLAQRETVRERETGRKATENDFFQRHFSDSLLVENIFWSQKILLVLLLFYYDLLVLKLVFRHFLV
jgi:hypothetical protein